MYLIVGGDSAIGKALGNYWENNNTDFHSSTRNLELASEARPFIDLENLNLSNLDYFYDVFRLLVRVTLCMVFRMFIWNFRGCNFRLELFLARVVRF